MDKRDAKKSQPKNQSSLYSVGMARSVTKDASQRDATALGKDGGGWVKWENTTLESLMRIETGSRNTEDKMDGARYPFFVRSQDVERINNYAYNCEAVLTAGDGVGTGKVFHYINGKFDAHQRVYVMSQFNGIDGKFFYYYFSRYFFDEVAKYTAKSSVDSVRRAMIAGMEIPLPPLPEQHRIAAALSDTDALIAALEKFIAKKRAIKQGAMQELLTGKRRLPGFSGEWVEKTLGAFGYCIRGVSYNPGSDLFSYANRNTVVLLRANNILNEKIDFTNVQYVAKNRVFSEQKLMPNDIIIAMSSGSVIAIGKTGFYTGSSNCRCVGAFCAIFRSKFNNYIRFLFQSTMYRTQLSTVLEGSSINNLNSRIIEGLTFSFPQDEEEITAIAEILSDMDAEIDALTAKLNKLRNIKQGMMSELLTGRIRLVEQGVAQEAVVATNVEAETVVKPKQKVAVKFAKLPKQKPEAVVEKTGSLRPQFNDAVAFAVIAKCFASEQQKLYRVKTYKLLYLFGRKQQIDLSGFNKNAAGPYKSDARYAGGEKIAIAHGYIVETKEEYGSSITMGENIETALEYARKWEGWRENAKWLIDHFKRNSTHDLETLATVDMAMRELRKVGKTVDLLSVKEVIRSNAKWEPKLTKPYFSDANITRAIAWSNDLFGEGYERE